MPENTVPESDPIIAVPPLDPDDDGLDPSNDESDGAAEDDSEDDGEALPDDPPGEH